MNNVENVKLPVRPMTAEQINQGQVGKVEIPKLDSSKIPMPVPPKNPIRFQIRGVTHTIPELKAIVAGLACDESLKKYLDGELDKIPTNAAEIHLHDIEKPNGGFDLHISVDPRHLGNATDKVFKRKE